MEVLVLRVSGVGKVVARCWQGSEKVIRREEQRTVHVASKSDRTGSGEKPTSHRLHKVPYCVARKIGPGEPPAPVVHLRASRVCSARGPFRILLLRLGILSRIFAGIRLFRLPPVSDNCDKPRVHGSQDSSPCRKVVVALGVLA